jgi:hypothetical protein
MAAAKRSQFGALPPRYKFILNPYPTQRISRCPVCDGKTGQRKVPLLVHVDPLHPIILNYTCRYCPHCDLLIAHKHEIEHLLTNLFRHHEPSAIGNDYLILGTVDRATWREGVKRPIEIAELPSYLHDFVAHYQELRSTRPGWYPEDQEPPIMEPPPSQEWVKARRKRQRRPHTS